MNQDEQWLRTTKRVKDFNFEEKTEQNGALITLSFSFVHVDKNGAPQPHARKLTTNPKNYGRDKKNLFLYARTLAERLLGIDERRNTILTSELENALKSSQKQRISALMRELEELNRP